MREQTSCLWESTRVNVLCRSPNALICRCARRPRRSEPIAPPGGTVTAMNAALHHVELWTTDVAQVEEGWRWLLTALGWSDGDTWADGRAWTHPDGTYVVLEQSPDVKAASHGRLRAGLNHLAVNSPSWDVLELLRDHGWKEAQVCLRASWRAATYAQQIHAGIQRQGTTYRDGNRWDSNPRHEDVRLRRGRTLGVVGLCRVESGSLQKLEVLAPRLHGVDQ